MTISKINQTEEHLIRRKEVQAKTELRASSIYTMMKDGKFPLYFHLSEKIVAWILSGVKQWNANRIAQHKAIQGIVS
ncbi:helix-turn-helix transcriptional regulator [Acinetobacter pittii]|uniref:helix-turn-helix transcriptional regulator n=1 Tax=Acinetobacter pittii TaxID=48296 RepID=UPI002DB764AB|nr:AlpA family phage regulatory protein [Acinetobacter pittii]MEB7642066.1 AlpA family transcriptional regulator [Acinetobacter pittii]